MKGTKIRQKSLIWKLPVSLYVRLLIDISMLAVVLMTTYMSIINNQLGFLIIPIIVLLSYVIFMYKGFYDMRVEFEKEGIVLVFFPFVRLLIPYKKIKSAQVTKRKWNDYLTGYGCKINKINDHIDILFRSRMSGNVVVLEIKNYKRIRRVEITIDLADEFINELENRLKKRRR
ncbi:MAG: hypothetical protein DRO95_00215 [Candidatus Altiarchaeales archaeon]|nr:MAG: hypothetical protein DRO95_00215 [Candidatus Altiarchaeales archaeon]HDO82531.1 hypothetical protein [Candidatus Altiarchaeales archaeon]HEX55180.1 hypothetical protein [Candidatus Altiarchaeales archaeon]